jgi:hypothetical protein
VLECVDVMPCVVFGSCESLLAACGLAMY